MSCHFSLGRWNQLLVGAMLSDPLYAALDGIDQRNGLSISLFGVYSYLNDMPNLGKRVLTVSLELVG